VKGQDEAEIEDERERKRVKEAPMPYPGVRCLFLSLFSLFSRAPLRSPD
jgi:hypothetical protein